MNTRGQQLKQVDIVKARLMSKLPNQYERECFAWVWDSCADMDSYVQMSLTRGDTSLRNKVFGDEWSAGGDQLLFANGKSSAIRHQFIKAILRRGIVVLG